MRRWWITSVGRAALAALVTGALWLTWPNDIRGANALAETGPQSFGTSTSSDERVGAQLAFTLPFFANQSGRRLTIESVRIVHVPPGWTILGYRLVALSAFGGVPLSWSETHSAPRDDPRPHFRPVDGLTVAPHTTSDSYGMVWVRLVARPEGLLRDVEVAYDADGVRHRQRMRARYGAELAPG